MRRIDPMKEVRAPVLLTHGRSMPTMNKPMIGPVITPVIRVPTSSMPGKYLNTYYGLICFVFLYLEPIYDSSNRYVRFKLGDKSNKNT